MSSKNLFELSRKKKKLIVGLMSGTSLDGIDAVLCEIIGNGFLTKKNQKKFKSYPFPKGLKKVLLENSTTKKGNVTDICKLNFLIALNYVDTVKQLCKKAGIPLNKIDLIGSHGQTIQHLPKKENYFGYKFGSTLQIGDPSVIAKLTGVLTVGDFRVSDVALGGEGAPLVPYFDCIFFSSKEKNRALLNIGGISNFTILNKIKRNGTKNIFAFDTGPGNMIIDFLSKKFFNKDFDKNGEVASKGVINHQLLNELIKKDNFIEKPPPKSTGREYYGKDFMKAILKKFKNIPREDWVTTATEFTSYAVFRNYELFIKKEIQIDELFVSGGGAKNKFLLKELKKYFGKNVEINNIKNLGISSDAKEAICFAFLANETVSGNVSNIPKITGAKHSTILGKICLP
jgi:anhydro-N-acetylmuramic acid kinase